MSDELALRLITCWLAVNAKGTLLFLLAGMVSWAFLRRRPAWRSWIWLMVMVGLALLIGLEVLWGGAARGAGFLAAFPDRLPAIFVQAYVLVAAALLGLLVHALIRLSLLKRQSPRLHVSWGVAEAARRALTQCLELLHGVDIRTNDSQLVPTSFGVLRPTIILPRAVDGTVYQQFARNAVLYEFVAVLRFDALWSLLGRIVQCLCFPNPVVWLAFANHRRAREQVCDDWSVYAIGESAGYAADLCALGRRPRVAGFLSPDTPMVSGMVAARASRIVRAGARPAGKPDVTGRWALLPAVVGWLVCLALLASIRAEEPPGEGQGFCIHRPTLVTGAALAAAAGAALGILAAGRRRGSGMSAAIDAHAPGAYRETVDRCVGLLAREWVDVQLLLSRAGRAAGSLVLLVFVAVLVTMAAAKAARQLLSLEDPYNARLWQAEEPD